ncbi:MAG: YIP1 family protein [Oscillochloridaceae bacterium umkhey_bin13]
MIELFNGALTLNQTIMRGLREAPDGVLRGFLLVLFVGALVGTATGINNLIQNRSPAQTVATIRNEVEAQLEQLVLTSNNPSTNEVVGVINRNKEPFFELLEELLSLPTPLPRPVGLIFQLVASMVSTPLSYLSGMLLAVAAAHLVAVQLGGQGSLQQMVALGSLSVAPHALDALAFIPVLGGALGLIAWFWGLAILVVGTAVAHQLDNGRATLAVLAIPLALLLLGTLAFCLLLGVVVALIGA